ncbi:uncharacterized protein MEPE_05817 [Melanopsichium pennsylvanicum]|uniref:FAD-binding PCMH-type domain-containing protein n=2 Tax=Melanopsichium pennsylvanicum TaxID=63383 RepID=A0AAJ5C7N5_9BASI|nr:fad-binding protein [Melanopsichium pennsylvanicum 4]SNX87107.1 uncharacterized protein MEPE_05817 [Melanopsichium pennsylvanicum]
MRFAAPLTSLLTVAITTTSVICSPAVSGADLACSELMKCNPSLSIITPSSNATYYTQAKNGGYNPLNNKLSPSCIVQPVTTADVATAMATIYRTKSRYAVRAGGHTGMAGWDSTQGGILIDFSKMTKFAYNKLAGSVSVQPGLRWGDIYAKAEQYGVCPMGGRVEHVGTGLILGGGLSLLSPQYGYACDGLMSVDVVLVDGTIKHVTAQSDPTLFRAIKGGGGRFGIVTNYQLRAFPTGHNTDKNWYGGSITTLTPAGMDQLVQVTEKFTATPDDPKATVLTNVGMIKQAGVPLYLGNTYLFYKGTQQEFNTVFKDFLSIPGSIPVLKPMSYLEAAATVPLGWKNTQAYKWIGGSLYPNSTLSSTSNLQIPLISPSPNLPIKWLKTWSNVKQFLVKHQDVLESGFFSITPVRSNQVEKGYQAGGNALTPPQGEQYMHWLFSQILAEGTTSFPNQFEQDRIEFLNQNPSDPHLPLFLNEVDVSQKTFQSYGWYREFQTEYSNVDPKAFSLKYQQGPMF